MPLVVAWVESANGERWVWPGKGRESWDEMLFMGVKGGRPEMATEALKHGASVHARDVDGLTPLMWAATLDDTTWVERLLRAGADPSATSREGITALIMAAKAGQVDAVERLLDAGADLRQSSRRLGTALHVASLRGHSEVIAVLLARGAPVDARDGRGRTPLMWAAGSDWERREGTLRQLITAGADLAATDTDGKTALAIAAEDGTREAVAVLREAAEHSASRGVRTGSATLP